MKMLLTEKDELIPSVGFICPTKNDFRCRFRKICPMVPLVTVAKELFVEHPQKHNNSN